MAGRKKTITPFQQYETRSSSGYETGYARFTASQNYSDSVKDLSDLAYRMFCDMKFVAKGSKEFVYTQKMAMENLEICKASYKKLITELVNVKLIIKCENRSAFAPSKFIFSAEWKNYESKRRDPMTRELVKKKQDKKQPQKKSQSMEQTT